MPMHLGACYVSLAQKIRGQVKQAFLLLISHPGNVAPAHQLTCILP